jgi:hypothetical protein
VSKIISLLTLLPPSSSLPENRPVFAGQKGAGGVETASKSTGGDSGTGDITPRRSRGFQIVTVQDRDTVVERDL